MILKFISEAKTYKWFSMGDTFFRGYFHREEQCYSKESALNLFASIDTMEKLDNMLKEIDGSFSACLNVGGTVILLVDRQRSLPLFYAIEDEKLYVSDSASHISNELNMKTINQQSVNEILSTNLFVTGKDTLIEQISQVCPGNYLLVNAENNTCTQVKYFSYSWGNYYEDSMEDLKEKFNVAYKKVGQKMVRALNGRTAVVPLSGGCDSRMILELLLKENYSKIICYTYGDTKSADCVISKQVAEQYGVEWHVVPYSTNKMKSFYHSDLFMDYFSTQGNLVSLPHLQDMVAVLELKKKGVFPEDSVFIPGHTGDVIAGSWVLDVFLDAERQFSRTECIGLIEKSFYQNHRVSGDVRLKLNNLIPDKTFSAEEACSIVESFNYNERQAKFIINSVRAYEYFGFEWLVPLWDRDIISFWSRISISKRFNRRLYYYCIEMNSNSFAKIPNIITKMKNFVKGIYLFRVIGKMVSEIYNYFTNFLKLRFIIRFPRFFYLVLTSPYKASLFHKSLVKYIVLPSLIVQCYNKKKNV